MRTPNIYMQNGNKIKNKRKSNAEHIIRTARRYSISDETSGMVRDWLTDGRNEEDKDEALRSIFDETVNYSKKTNAKWEATLPGVKNKLGMGSQATRIPLYRRVYFQVASAAAVLLIALGVGYNLTQNDADNFAQGGKADSSLPTNEIISFETVDGVQKNIVLADNTTIWLNSKSKITYPKEFGRTREVTLEGEAFFEVAHDKKRPFIVRAGEVEVRVLGTKFNIKAYPDSEQTQVMLTEGSVEVKAGRKREKLVPGQLLTYAHDSGKISVEPSEMIDWRSDAIVVGGRTLEQLFIMVGNYYDVEVVFAKGRFDKQVIVTSFNEDHTAEDVIRALSVLSGEFSYTIQDDKIFIRETNTVRQH